MSPEIEIGRLLRASTTGCVVGCRVSQLDVPSFGCMVCIPLEADYRVFGLVHDIHIDDDGLVRQLVTAGDVPPAVIADNRANRNVPVEISVLFVGYESKITNKEGKPKKILSHLLPPRPPLSLDRILLCADDDLRRFTSTGNFSYFRHVLRAQDLPVGELLAAHIQQAQSVYSRAGDDAWYRRAVSELIGMLRDDYPSLMAVLGALTDALGQKEAQ
jgi:hypothetical protein